MGPARLGFSAGELRKMIVVRTRLAVRGVLRFSRRWASRCSIDRSASAISGPLAWAMSRHMEYGLAPRRVISRRARPPMARTSGASPKRSSSMALKAVDRNWGRWLTQAQISSCLAARISMVRQPKRPPSPPLGGQGMSGELGEEPDRFVEEMRVGVRRAADFFARHGVSRKKAGLAGAAEERTAPRSRSPP